MRRYQLFAAGVSVALLLGAATPALAKPGKAKGHEKHTASKPGKGPKADPTPGKKAPPATKGKKSGVSGGGAVSNGTFSIQARVNSKARGHFNYTSTDGLFKVRCRQGFKKPVTLDATAGTAQVIFNACQVTGQTAPADVTVDVKDGGKPDKVQPSVTPVADWISFGWPNLVTAYSGNLTDGNVKVR